MAILIPNIECRTVIRLDRPETVCEQVGWRIWGVGGSGSSGGGIESGGGRGDECPPGPSVCLQKKLEKETRKTVKEANARERKRESDFRNCLHTEMAEPMRQLNDLMYKHLGKWRDKVGIGSIGGLLRTGLMGAFAGIGMLGGSYIALSDWYDELVAFEETTFEPTRQAAIKKCRELTGYQGKL